MSTPDQNSRLLAFQCLQAITQDGRTLDQAMQTLAPSTMSKTNLDLAHALCTHALRRWGSLGALIKTMVPKAPPPDVQLILKLGITQVLLMRIPAHAAVSETVDLAKSQPKTRHQAKLVNAVLRRIVREDTQLPDAPEVPIWLHKNWQKTYGKDVVKTMSRAPRVDTPLCLTINPHINCPDLHTHELAADDGHGGLKFPTDTNVMDLPGFDDGAFWVQNPAARLPAHMLDVKADEDVLDLCAAPGGKTLQLAATGANIDALDINKHRMQTVQNNLDRTRLKANLIAADALTWAPNKQYDAILLDAPCTATGTLQKKPDVVWNLRPRAVQHLASIQKQMLMRAVDWLKPGGRLVYSTCSLEVEEGEHILKALPRTHVYKTKRILPTDGLQDGFFMALIKP